MNIKSYGQRLLSSFLVALIIGTIAFVSPYFGVGTYTMTLLGNCLFFAGAVVFSLPLFLLIGRSGTFDIFAFSFHRFVETLKRDPTPAYPTAYDYSEHKKELRKANRPLLWPYFVVSVPLLVSALIVSLIAVS